MIGGVPTSRVAAVVEVGSSAVRMAVGQRGPGGELVVLDTLEQSLGLGRDTFTTETIGAASMEQGVQAIRRFLEALRPYDLPAGALRVVATSAVREARNGTEFTDRVLIATGARIDILDEADISRLTYIAARRQLREQRFFRQADTFLIEVGGGNTQTILFRKGRVSAAHEYRLGSLRIERDLQGYQLSAHTQDLLREYLAQPVEQVVGAVGPTARLSMVALGSELRFASHRLHGEAGPGPLPPGDRFDRLTIADLERFTRQVLAMTPEESARQYGIGVQQAENMGPALYVLVAVAKALRQKSVWIGEGSLRHGVLIDLLGDPGWNEEYRRQVLSSTLAIARRYRVDLKHARHVALYANTLLAALRDQFTFGEHDDVILTVAALLHEVGMFVNDRSYHKHTLYLIEHSEIFGLGTADLRLAARVARYHRRATPKMTHDEYVDMSVAERTCVVKLAAILRVANALDHLRPNRAFEIDTHTTDDRFVITLRSTLDLTLTRHHLAERAELFCAVFGMRVVLRAGPDAEASDDVAAS